MDFDNLFPDDMNNENVSDREYVEKEIDIDTNVINRFNKLTNYKIARNEPCPCGSGKKYKNCCANVEPDKELDYYLKEIHKHNSKPIKEKSMNDIETFYQLLKKANQDYPVNSIFSNLAGIIAWYADEPEQAIKYLLKHFHIVNEEISKDTLQILISSLYQVKDYVETENQLEEIAKVVDYPVLDLHLGEVKLILGKNKKGYQKLMDGYKKSNNDIYYLNDTVKILKENRQYKKAYQLVAKYFYKFNLLDKRVDYNNAEMAKELIDEIYNLEDEVISTKEYKGYVEEIIEVFDVLNLNTELTEETIKKIEKIIGTEIDIGFYLEGLLNHHAEYQYISDNEQALLGLSEDSDVLIDLIIRANYFNKDYQKVIDNFRLIFDSNYINSSSKKYIQEYLKLYLKSLYHVNNQKYLEELLKILDENIEEDIASFIKETTLDLNAITELNILQWIREVNKNRYLDDQKIIDFQLYSLLDFPYIADKTVLDEDQKEWITKLLSDFDNYDKDTFIYHYSKWILDKSSDKKYEKDLEEIVEYPAGTENSRSLKYLIIIKMLDPNRILNDPPEKDKPILYGREFHEMLAKFKKGDFKNILTAMEEYPYDFRYILESLMLIMNIEEIQTVINESINIDNIQELIE